MESEEKVTFTVEIGRDLNTELQQVITQSGLSTADTLQELVKCFKSSTINNDPEIKEIISKITELIKRLEDKYPENGYIPVTVLLQNTHTELLTNVKNLLNKLYPESFSKPQKSKILGFSGY